MSETNNDLKPWSREEFEEKLREKGKGYHIYHPFHVMMYEGKLSKEQLQSWVANRFYYQIAIPMKDGAILSNCPDVEVRKQWIVRITDHDGVGDTMGGIKVNDRMEVLDNINNPIPGLYAAGVVASGWEAETYCSDLSGSAFGFAISSGRIAGENAADFIRGR